MMNRKQAAWMIAAMLLMTVSLALTAPKPEKPPLTHEQRKAQKDKSRALKRAKKFATAAAAEKASQAVGIAASAAMDAAGETNPYRKLIATDWVRQVKQYQNNDFKAACAKMVKLASETFTLVDQDNTKPQWRKTLAGLNAKQKTITDAKSPKWLKLYLQIRWLRREAIMTHPKLNFASLLFNKRSPPGYDHQCDQYLGRHSRPAVGLFRLDNWKAAPKAVELLKGKLPKGAITHPDLSYDAKRIAFAFCDQTVKNPLERRFFIYEATVDGKTVRQLTGTKRDPLEGADGLRTVLIEDFDACYLPDGDLVFISTRSQNFGRCHGTRYTPSYLMYRCDKNGDNIRQISFGEANEWDPCVLFDGRLVYTRWDYINRHDTFYQGLWHTRPDGTGVGHYFGSYTRNPCMSAESRPIPGTNKIVSTSTAHHAYTAGSLVIVDVDKGEDGKAPITRITPEIEFPETEGRCRNGVYCTPWPIDETLYIASFTFDPLAWQGHQQAQNAYGIYLIDTLGGRELIFRDTEFSCLAPIPLTPRQRPRILASALPKVPPKEKTGVFYVQDIYQSRYKIEPGSVKSLRINKIYNQIARAKPQHSAVQNEVLKSIIGTVPVNADGSVAFTAPAGVGLQLQALDAKGQAIMTMRSLVYLQPGEVAGCVGCHEQRGSTPVNKPLTSLNIRTIKPSPISNYPKGLRFMPTVQPVLDRHCIKCHGLKEKLSGKVNLLGLMQNSRGQFARPEPLNYTNFKRKIACSTSYSALISHKGLIRLAHRNQESGYSTPKDYFSHASKLPAILDKHKGVKMNPADRQRVIDWLDLNCQFYGDYTFNRVEERKIDAKGEIALRAFVEQRFGKKLAKQPFAALVNVGDTNQSRILLAPLPESKGGWGQVEKGFTSKTDPDYCTAKQLVEASLRPLKNRNTAWGTDTGNRSQCEWVKPAEEKYRQQLGIKALAPKETKSKK